MRNVVQLFSAANTILLVRKWNHACSLLVYVISVITPGRQRAQTAFRRYYLFKKKKQTQWSNDKTIIFMSITLPISRWIWRYVLIRERILQCT